VKGEYCTERKQSLQHEKVRVFREKCPKGHKKGGIWVNIKKYEYFKKFIRPLKT